MQILLAVFVTFGSLLAFSAARPVNQRLGFASAKHVLIIGCDGFGKTTDLDKQYYTIVRTYSVVLLLSAQEECTSRMPQPSCQTLQSSSLVVQ